MQKKLAKAMKERNMLDARVDPVEYWEINGVVEKLEIESQQIDKSLKEWK